MTSQCSRAASSISRSNSSHRLQPRILNCYFTRVAAVLFCCVFVVKLRADRIAKSFDFLYRSIQNPPEHVEVFSVYADRTVLCFGDAPRVGLMNHGEASAGIE